MIIDKVIYMIEKYNMVRPGEGIVVGLSGGPDSVCLLHVLYCLKEKYNFNLYAVHLNHMIRGEEALRDEAFAKQFAESLGIPFFSERIKVEEFARERGMSSEEAGRHLRYTLFDRILKEKHAHKIALAHNMNDQTETMIMRFLRGTGINGIGGIRPIRDNKYIRPILSCSREEIEEYCRINNLSPVIDSTNSESIYTRNRIRLEVLPYIKENFNPNIDENLFRVSSIFRDEDEFLNISAESELNRITFNAGISRQEFKKLHIAIKRRIVRLLIEKVKGNLIGIENKHIEECVDFVENSGTGKRINLPESIECFTEYEYFKIAEKSEILDYEYEIKMPGETQVKDDYRVITKIFELNNKNLLDKQLVKYFDYDKIKDGLYFRNRRDGDYIYPKGMSGRKKLKDLFIDKKIPKEERDRIPLIACGNEILWILNMRDSKNYKLSNDTRHVLEVAIERGGING